MFSRWLFRRRWKHRALEIEGLKDDVIRMGSGSYVVVGMSYSLHYSTLVGSGLGVTCSHSHRFVAIMCIRPNFARAPCLASSRSLLFRNMKCIWAVTSRSLALGVIALNGPPDAISAPICNPVKTNEPAPNPTAPSRRQKLPYCCA